MTEKTTQNEKERSAVTKGDAEQAPKKPKYDPQELLAIFDEMIFSGEYQETVSIKGKLKVTFRTRSVNDITEMTRETDGKNFTLISSLAEHRALLNLAYSLVSYAGKDLSSMSIEDRKKFIGSLSGVIGSALSEALVKFDEKVSAAFAEGEENF